MKKGKIQNVSRISTQITQIIKRAKGRKDEGAKGTNNEHFLVAFLLVACSSFTNLENKFINILIPK
jgi:hypothetical protein